MQISGKHVWQGRTVQFLKRKTLTSLSVKFKQTHLCLVATSKPDQNNKAVRPYLKRANRVVRPEAHSRWSKKRSPAWQESITRILWYWVRLTVLIQCFFGRLVLPLSVLLPRDTNTRACYALPHACLPEKAFSHAKGFCLLTAVKMSKQRLDTNNSVMSLSHVYASFYLLWMWI